MIIYKNVQKSYGDREIIRDVNFTVEQGELVVMIGPSGCGKSTLGRLLLRLYEDTDGQIIYDGTDITKLNAKEL